MRWPSHRNSLYRQLCGKLTRLWSHLKRRFIPQPQISILWRTFKSAVPWKSKARTLAISYRQPNTKSISRHFPGSWESQLHLKLVSTMDITYDSPAWPHLIEPDVNICSNWVKQSLSWELELGSKDVGLRMRMEPQIWPRSFWGGAWVGRKGKLIHLVRTQSRRGRRLESEKEAAWLQRALHSLVPGPHNLRLSLNLPPEPEEWIPFHAVLIHMFSDPPLQELDKVEKIEKHSELIGLWQYPYPAGHFAL